MEASQLPGGRRGDDVSQLWSLVLLLSFFFWGRRGPVSFRAVKGKGGESALELCCLVLRGMEASQLPGGRR